MPIAEAQARLRHFASEATLLPHGNGRSYGDTCINEPGFHVLERGTARIHQLDLENGLLVADPSVTLSQVIAALAGTGWFLAVVPGTQHVTLGGAVANDIHGKNHHARGTFGCHVERLTLLRSDRGPVTCSRDENADLFNATIGGMGLTGLITEVTIRLMQVGCHSVLARTRPFSSLEGYFDLASGEADRHEYAVAWIDQLAGGRAFGRGLFFLGDHADQDAPHRRGMPLAVPFTPPISCLNGLSLRAFNFAYRAAKGRQSEARVTAPDPFFFQLDGVKNWNRLYGPRGLFQHQCVLPEAGAREGVRAMLEASHEFGQASFLTVLKRFGTIRSPGLLSFPRAGHTLTLDFPNRGAKTLALLDRLDAIVRDHGGAVNPYKDARMSPETFAMSFPDWRKMEALRDPAFLSDFWRRTALKLV